MHHPMAGADNVHQPEPRRRSAGARKSQIGAGAESFGNGFRKPLGNRSPRVRLNRISYRCGGSAVMRR